MVISIDRENNNPYRIIVCVESPLEGEEEGEVGEDSSFRKHLVAVLSRMQCLSLKGKKLMYNKQTNE